VRGAEAVEEVEHGDAGLEVATWAMRAKSMASWTEAELSIEKPVLRACITSLWSPKIERAWVAMVRAVTWKTVGLARPRS